LGCGLYGPLPPTLWVVAEREAGGAAEGDAHSVLDRGIGVIKEWHKRRDRGLIAKLAQATNGSQANANVTVLGGTRGQEPDCVSAASPLPRAACRGPHARIGVIRSTADDGIGRRRLKCGGLFNDPRSHRTVVLGEKHLHHPARKANLL
jgi:transposase